MARTAALRESASGVPGRGRQRSATRKATVVGDLAVGQEYRAVDEVRVVWVVTGLVHDGDVTFVLLLSKDMCRFAEVRAEALLDTGRFARAV
ncbi:hypothetical protein [Acuticoccus mangrovi]|uniref:Uncharacterized protein n=1 Tax=Acuticoccus mangrovi TaxID=2796142 RepID=A0A934ITQ1_9HYPH|nr:hypothetical protein [Acuticoccus mangrovi]MBJ3778012.1 hypothetical protein [Acuticoccus mangrovi]